MKTHSARPFVAAALSFAVLFMLSFFVQTQAVYAADTMVFDLEKKFSGPVPEGYTADQFTFNITTITDPVSLVAHTDDSANGTVDLGVGTYTITENGPAGFDPDEWTIQWTGAGCENITGLSSTITIEQSDLTKTNFGCRADNQWRHGTLRIVKEFVGTSSAYENFEFTVTQGATERYNGPFEADGDNSVLVAEGDYDVEETVYTGYTPSYSAGCSGTMAHNDSVTCTITNTYVDTPILGCTDSSANNYDASATQDDGSCTYDIVTATGTIEVTKVVVGTTTSPADFSFTVNSGSAVAFPVNGTTSIVAATGTYDVVESAAPGYIVTYSAGCSGTLAADETVSCTITNTYSEDPILGCTDPTANNYNSSATQDDGSCTYDDTDTYIIEGYVWHDDNENAEWDGFQSEENADDTEDELVGWTVEITNGQVTYATVTDSSGYYSFEVPAGTWTITQVLEDGWERITPAGGSFEVTVPEVLTQSWTQQLFAYVIPTAHAAVIATYGPFNFGNNESSTTGGGGGSSSGGGGGGDKIELTQSSGGGGGTTSSNDTGSGGDVVTPEPTVLGEQVSIVPYGAPAAGHGATSPLAAPWMLAIAFAWMLAVVALGRYAR